MVTEPRQAGVPRYPEYMTRTPLGPAALIYAHRGDRSRAQDNTLEAYRLAIEAGTDGIELDVRRTADGVLILSHDDHVAGLEPFSVLSMDALRASAPHVPTLREAMDAIDQSVFVNVELKNFTFDAGYDEERTLVDDTIAELSTFDNLDRILLSSFDAIAMQRARQIDSGVRCAQLLLQVVPLDAGIEIATDMELDAIVPHLDHLRHGAAAHVQKASGSGLATVVWGVNAPSDVALMADAGVNGIITDDPAMARDIFDHR